MSIIYRKKVTSLFLTMALFTFAGAAEATCSRQVGTTTGYDGNSAPIPIGHINLLADVLQPVGSSLGSVISYPGRNRLAGDETIIYICDIGDENSLYEIIGLNEDRVGSYYNVGVPDFQYTWFQNVAARLIHINSGLAFTTTWQQVPLTNYSREIVNGAEKIVIRGKHLSPIQVDFMKIDTLPPLRETGVSYYCGNNNTPGSGISRLTTTSKTTYTCAQPLAYSIFTGPGISDRDLPGKSVKDYTGWANNWYGVTMTNVAYLSQIPSCIVRNHTPVVFFSAITAHQLNSGQSVSELFSVTVECSQTTISGVASNNTAIGLQVSEAAYQRAQEVGGLINASGGVSYLLSDEYGINPNIATGVGIQISNADNPNRLYNFVGWDSCMSDGSICTPRGNNAGWYRLDEDSYNTSAGSDPSTYSLTKNYLATLKALPGKTATTGRINARAYVLVKIQ